MCVCVCGCVTIHIHIWYVYMKIITHLNMCVLYVIESLILYIPGKYRPHYPFMYIYIHYICFPIFLRGEHHESSEEVRPHLLL